MNTKSLKAYAPKARRQFIDAVKKRAAHLGIYETHIADMQIQGSAAVIEGRVFTSQQGEQRKRLEKKVMERGYDMFVREMAYTWFNRLAAIRYMELHDYLEHGFRVLSHPDNADGMPEILNHASDVADTLGLDKGYIVELQLAGDKEGELYRELLLGQCHYLYQIMPFMFEAIDDASELLLPDNLTKTDSILKGLINDIPEEDWQEIEVIGWLYQFYISEHKDAVMGKVVKSEDIPAATQLFTPNWIVKYLVQNSVGRQWLATYPDSELKDKMEYYIEPATQSEAVTEQLKAITPESIDPENIKVLDPAAGSGHILVEVYEVLREIYLERGYRLREIPELILTKNIYGLDIDDRAAQLAGFALIMKAREDDRRIFERIQRGDVKLNVLSLQSSEHLDIPTLWNSLNLDGKQKSGVTREMFENGDNFEKPDGEFLELFELIQTLKSRFIHAKTLGSLIDFDHELLPSLVTLKEALWEKVSGGNPSEKLAANTLVPYVEQAIVLAQQYDAVIANPPYMGGKGMNAHLKDFAKLYFPKSKSDLFAMFMERTFDLLTPTGLNAQVNMQSWMFLSGHEQIRNHVIASKTIETMAHLGARAFGQISGDVVQTTAWVIRNQKVPNFVPVFYRLTSLPEEGKKESLKSNQNRYHHSSIESFQQIPGNPIAYWLSDNFLDAFRTKKIEDICISNGQNKTANNDKFVRFHWEVDREKVGRNRKWFLYAKGGTYRKWAGNLDSIVDWSESARKHYRKDPSCRIIPEELWFERGVTWSRVGSPTNPAGFRVLPENATFDMVGSSVFISNDNNLWLALAALNSNISKAVFEVLNPSVDIQVKDVMNFPLPSGIDEAKLISSAKECFDIMQDDWNSLEMSFDFKGIPIISFQSSSIEQSFLQMLSEAEKQIKQCKYQEEDINRLILNSFNLAQEFDSEVNLSHVTHSLNRYFMYGDIANNFLIQRSDILSGLLSYSIGCMMGRYSLDSVGTVYASSNNDVNSERMESNDYCRFNVDDDGIIPLASEEWLFDDDATTRFKEFVKTVWPAEHIEENLEFVAESLCLSAIKPKKGERAMDTIRRYFSTQFFKDHCKTYKKRPIYWLFSSGKEKAFECLVYLHRYNEGTLSRMRTEYVTPLMGKYEAQFNLLSEQKAEATGTEARRIERDLKAIEKKQLELRGFDEQLKHYAEMRISLDLDDGVKANYGKFGNLLADVKSIHGKAVK